MQWFRNLFGGKAARPAPVRPSVRPQLEALEERQLLNASTVFDSAGNKTTFVVYFNAGNNIGAGGVAYRYGPNGASIIGTGVKLVHGYKDQNGQVGFDIVYANGYAAEFDSTGARQIGNGSNVLDASHAFDANGNFKFDVLYRDGKVDGFGNNAGTGNLFEYNNKGGGLVAQNVGWATAYVDTNGVLSNAYGFVDLSQTPGGFTFLIREFQVDSQGTRVLGSGQWDVPAIVGGGLSGLTIGAYSDFDQVTDPNGKALVDLTSISVTNDIGAPGNIQGITSEVTANGVTTFGPNLNPF